MTIKQIVLDVLGGNIDPREGYKVLFPEDIEEAAKSISDKIKKEYIPIGRGRIKNIDECFVEINGEKVKIKEILTKKIINQLDNKLIEISIRVLEGGNNE